MLLYVISKLVCLLSVTKRRVGAVYNFSTSFQMVIMITFIKESEGPFLYSSQMFEWISHNRDLFLVNYTEIGTCHQMAVELESEHCQFATSAEVCLSYS